MKKIEKILRETDEQFDENNIALEIESREQALAGALLNAKRDLNVAKLAEKTTERDFIKGDDAALEQWINARAEVEAYTKLVSEIEEFQKLMNEEVKA